MPLLRVVIADDHGLVRSGLRAILAGRGMEVVGEAADGRTLVSLVRAQRPDVAVVDVSMPLLDGLEAARRIARMAPETGIVILTMHDDPRFVARAREVGAAAYVRKDAEVDELVAAVHRVAAGEHPLGPAEAEDPDMLTEREREVLRLVVEGKKNVEIAKILSRSVHTVRSHRARLMRKLGIRAASDWADAAERVGIVACSGSSKEIS